MEDELRFPGGDPLSAMSALSAMIKNVTERPVGRYRCEDLISAAAAFAGENMLAQVEGFNFSNHQLTPGRPVFSAAANKFLSGDQSDWADIPATSAFGRLFAILPRLSKTPYPDQAFPNTGAVYRQFSASRKGGVSKQDWGTASLTIPSIHWPFKPPLQCAYELRRMISAQWQEHEPTPAVLSELAQLCLLEFLVIARTTRLQPQYALSLAIETMNAMAKTAPMLPKHLPEGLRHS